MEKTKVSQELIQNIASQLRYSTNKADFVSRLYWALKVRGYDSYIVNERYLNVEGKNFMFINQSRKRYYFVVEY